MKGFFILLFCVLAIFFFSSCHTRKSVSLILHHGHIYTVDSSFSRQQAMAINEGKILATGTDDEIFEKYVSDSIIDLEGKSVFPGFIDAHCHFTGFATDMWKCDLTGTHSFGEVVDRIKSFASTSTHPWIYGRGWDQNDWADKSFPNRKLLDSLFPNTPVFLKRIDGHAALVNGKALQLAGVTDSTRIIGGEFELKNGKLTGILIDNAMDFVEEKIPPIQDALANEYFLKAQRICFADGLTSVHDCGINEHTLQLVDRLQQAGKLKMKIFALLSDSMPYIDEWVKKKPYETARLRMGGFKVYADGALGSRGACLLQDYSDRAGWRGFMLTDSATLETIAAKLANTPYQMCTHAIGDSANRSMLKIYSRHLKKGNNKRWRIEHAQVVAPSDLHFFSDYQIVPSVQPTHATSDMYWAESRLGPDRIKYAYAYRDLLATNHWMPLGTDFPVEDISPIKTFFAAVIRKDSAGYPPNGFQVTNMISRKDAIRGMTIWAAKAGFEEAKRGSLEKGKEADFVILDTDIIICPEKEILDTKVIATFSNGEKVYALQVIEK
ncbi:MAG: amidohydrolase [Chitinophagaceae bacterium]|nr:amidohydrolase [Chitinophagaceae bacterium]